jgi:hypothetical protein
VREDITVSVATTSGHSTSSYDSVREVFTDRQTVAFDRHNTFVLQSILIHVCVETARINNVMAVL